MQDADIENVRVTNHLNLLIFQLFMILIVLPEKGSRPTIFPTPPIRSLDFGIFSHLLSYGYDWVGVVSPS